jgi:hypothetical protein
MESGDAFASASMPVSGAMPRQAATKGNRAITLLMAMHHTQPERIGDCDSLD